MIRRFLLSLILFLLSATTWADSEPAAYPQWWLDRGVVNAQPPTPTDFNYEAWMQANYAPANLGQLKMIASGAKAELDAVLAPVGGAGPVIDSVVSLFSTDPSDNYAVLNQGQLKYISSLFFNRLGDVTFNGWPANYTLDSSTGYPWTESVTDDAHYAPANTGQLKYLFLWDLNAWADSIDYSTIDADGDGLGDIWEIAYNLSPFDDGGSDSINGPNGDPDGDGLTNLQEYEVAQTFANAADPSLLSPRANDSDGDGRIDGVEVADGTDPTDYYNLASPVFKRTPVVEVLSGDDQTVGPGEILANAISVKVTAQEDGSLLVNAPLCISPEALGAMVGVLPDGSDLKESIIVYTNASGIATFYVKP